ncbi:hypothetical protein AXG93_2752s2080 [Marchantia polymorpha subsp. ruderalis]|uniref:Uncharacterized protein n=1 Tax=Marchantia polymorpha subsp. ruderalis TaxID=1480154 RepID=A0A176VUZ6_MARPO|nr:hypothetical protein AXG93_2752s2080 [Marchantia polymorpha subsp. ruderalis]
MQFSRLHTSLELRVLAPKPEQLERVRARERARESDEMGRTSASQVMGSNPGANPRGDDGIDGSLGLLSTTKPRSSSVRPSRQRRARDRALCALDGGACTSARNRGSRRVSSTPREREEKKKKKKRGGKERSRWDEQEAHRGPQGAGSEVCIFFTSIKMRVSGLTSLQSAQSSRSTIHVAAAAAAAAPAPAASSSTDDWEEEGDGGGGGAAGGVCDTCTSKVRSEAEWSGLDWSAAVAAIRVRDGQE